MNLKMLLKNFLLLLLFCSPFFAIAEKEDPVKIQSLDQNTQEFICQSQTSGLVAEDICLKDNSLTIEKLTVCYSYTSSALSEVLCLKNRLLNSEDILKCFSDTPELIEQICLLKSEISNRIVSHFLSTDTIPSNILKKPRAHRNRNDSS